MGTNLIAKAARAARQSPTVLVLWLVFVAMAVIGTALGIEDYRSTYLGYLLVPTRKSYDWVNYFVAAMPQVAGVGFAAYFMFDNGRRWSMAVSIAAWLIDLAADMYYRIVVWTLEVIVAAFIEGVFVFTLGSEVFFLVGWTMTVALFPDAMNQLGKLGTMVADVVLRVYYFLRPMLRAMSKGFRGFIAGFFKTREEAEEEEDDGEEEEDASVMLSPALRAARRHQLSSSTRSLFPPRSDE